MVVRWAGVLVVGVLGATWTPPAAQASVRAASVAQCPGAPLPAGYGVAGYGVAGSMPYSTHAPTGARYNPQGIALFMRATWANSRATPAQRRCLLVWAADALDAGSQTRVFQAADGYFRVARLYPYPYTFSVNPSLPAIGPNWISGLAQASVLTAMASLYDDTRDERYLEAAQHTFNSFLLPAEIGGFATRHSDLTYLQEYVTSEPAYVLNGHNEAVLALARWAKRTGDPTALDVARRALSALHTTTQLAEVPFPDGVASSYDLLRGWPAAPLRAAPRAGLTVHGAWMVGFSRTGRSADVGAARVVVQKVTGRGPERLRNASFSAWTHGTPTGWTVAGQGRAASIRRGEVAGSVRVVSNGTAHVVVQQTLPVVAKATQFTVAWTARLAVVRGVDSTPGDVVLQAVCGRTVSNVAVTDVAVADVRSPQPVEQTVSGRIPARCAPRVKLLQADGAAPSDVTYSGVSLRVSDPIGTARTPVYPMSVLDVPEVSIRLTYSGSGWLQAWWRGRWTTLAILPQGTRSTVTVAVPAYLQGRTVNLRYHNAHVAELTELYELTGDTLLRDRALAWLPYAPAMERYRARLEGPVTANLLYADLFRSS